MDIEYSLNDQKVVLLSDHTNHILGIHRKILRLQIIHVIIQIDLEHILQLQLLNDLSDDQHMPINLKHVIPAMML